MKRYRIVRNIVLGFTDPQDQCDMLINAGELECDGETIWWIRLDHVRSESITSVNAIDQWVKEGRIEEAP